MKKVNKNKVVVPYEVIADLLYKTNEKACIDAAVLMVYKMKDNQEIIDILVRIRRPAEAVGVACEHGYYELVDVIREKFIASESITREIDRVKKDKMPK